MFFGTTAAKMCCSTSRCWYISPQIMNWPMRLLVLLVFIDASLCVGVERDDERLLAERAPVGDGKDVVLLVVVDDLELVREPAPVLVRVGVKAVEEAIVAPVHRAGLECLAVLREVAAHPHRHLLRLEQPELAQHP